MDNITHFEDRLSKLTKPKLLSFTTFCLQAAIRNIDVYAESVGIGNKLKFNNRMHSWFWDKLRSKDLSFDLDYQTVESELMDVITALDEYPVDHDLKPIPNSVMGRETIYLFISNSAFFANRGDLQLFLTTLDNCISVKIDTYFDEVLEMHFYEADRGLQSIYTFPAYGHAITDLTWALELLEKQKGEWPAPETLNLLFVYAKNSATFVVPEPMYLR